MNPTPTQPTAAGQAAHTPKWHEETRGLSWSKPYGDFSAEVAAIRIPCVGTEYTAWLSNGGADGTHSESRKFMGRGALAKAKGAADEMARASLLTYAQKQKVRDESMAPWHMKNDDGSDFYNEKGPTWYVFPIERSEEFGNRIAYLVADVDGFDEKNRCGNFMAECSTMSEAQAIVRACNSHAALVEALGRAESALEDQANMNAEEIAGVLAVIDVALNLARP